MKKYLFLAISILSIFFITEDVKALTFDVNGVETEVTEENLIYYLYANHEDDFNNYKYFVLKKTSSGNFYISLVNTVPYFSDSSTISLRNGYYYLYNSNYEFIRSSQISSALSNFSGISSVLHSNVDILNSSNNLIFEADMTKQDLIDYYTSKPIYTITYYINNEIYKTIEVEEGSIHSLIEYMPPENYRFNGWNTDSLDLSNITSDINIYGTTTYVRPDMNYSEDIDSVIHEISIAIIGKNVPVEFDYVYTVMDFIILLLLVFVVLAPFIILIKLLSGRW